MSHLDDGQIHMLLDGALELLGRERAGRLRAHLESCADCRARLDEEAGTRERAREVLEEAAPGSVDLPSLEELRREAVGRGRGGRKRRRRLPRGVALAWAASLVLALGAGLYGPELLERSRAVPPGPSVREQAPPEPAGEPGPSAPAADLQVADEAAPSERTASAEETVGSGPRGSVAGARDAGAETGESEAVRAPVEQRIVGADSPSEVQPFRARAPDVEADIRRAMEAAFRRRGDTAGALPGAAGLRPSAKVGADETALPATTVATPVRDLRAVPGLEILEVEELAGGGARIRQALPEGDTLVVWHLPEGQGGLDRLPGLPEAWTQFGILREGSGAYVILRARRSQAFLGALASRFR